jgi:hypothetical protein
MDLNLDNVLEVIEIRKLISHKKNLLEFFDELIKVKNLMINESSANESSASEAGETDTDSDYCSDD